MMRYNEVILVLVFSYDIVHYTDVGWYPLQHEATHIKHIKSIGSYHSQYLRKMGWSVVDVENTQRSVAVLSLTFMALMAWDPE